VRPPGGQSGLRLRGAAVRAAAARVARLARIAPPAPEAVIVPAAGIVQLGLGPRRPPDQPEAEETGIFRITARNMIGSTPSISASLPLTAVSEGARWVIKPRQ
jgi:hypothetical protein